MTAYKDLSQHLARYMKAEQENGDIDSHRTYVLVSLASIKPEEVTVVAKDELAIVDDGMLNLGPNLMTKIAPGEANLPDPNDLNWLIDPTRETIEEVLADNTVSLETARELMAKGPSGIDMLYLIKWGNLGYMELTWEYASVIRNQDPTNAKIKDFERFNRSLDNNAR